MPDGSSLPEIKISQLPVGTAANLTDLLEASQQSGGGYVTASISVGQVATAVAGTLPAPPTIPTTLPPSGPAGGALNGTYPNPGLVGGPLSNYALISSIPATLPPSGAAAGDLAGSYPNPTIKANVGLSGAPTSTTPATADNTTKIATTAFVKAQGYALSSSIPTTLPPNGAAGGMLNGTYPNPGIAPSGTNGQVLTTVSGAAAWAAPGGGPPTGAAGGMLSGSYPNPAIAPGSNGQQLTTIGGAAAWVAGWRQIARVVPTAGQPTIDFTNLPSDINDLQINFDVTPTTNAQDLLLQFYNAAGSLITTNYSLSVVMSSSAMPVGANPIVSVFQNASIFCLTYSATSQRVNNSASGGIRGQLVIPCIRDTTRGKGATWSATHLNDVASAINNVTGGGTYTTVGAISGVRFSFGSGNFAAGGAVSLWGSP